MKRIGYGAMQLAGPGVMDPPEDPAAAVALLREAVELGVDHIHTSDAYGPHATNRLIREALHPDADPLTIVTKVGAIRGDDGAWPAAQSPEDIRQVHDNLRNLRLEVLDVVNLRSMFDVARLVEGALKAPLTALAELQQRGLVRYVGLSNDTRRKVEDAARICDIVCVQNLYNLVPREDDALIDQMARRGIAYVPFFPLGGFTPLQSKTLGALGHALGVAPMQLALAWLLHRSPDILDIPGTASVAHLRQNLAAASLALPTLCMRSSTPSIRAMSEPAPPAERYARGVRPVRSACASASRASGVSASGVVAGASDDTPNARAHTLTSCCRSASV